MSDRERPPWHDPSATATTTAATGSTRRRPRLQLYNSLTKSKVDFVPAEGNTVRWYICGPTVYDAAHMGHARAYITFDILRRVFEEYFNYDVFFQMNITDVDDKIILRARQNHLFTNYKRELQEISEAAWQDLQGVFAAFVKKNLQIQLEAADVHSSWSSQTAGPMSDALKARLSSNAKFKMHFDTATSMFRALTTVRDLKAANALTKQDIDAFLDSSRDILSEWLDDQSGASVTDHEIFRELSSYWERDFFADMEKLGVRRADAVTRVTEYIPAIIDFTKRIVDEGFAYETEGSVYFDTAKFDNHEKHFYAKLEPKSAFNLQLIDEGEGSISLKLGDKRSKSDFALWKKSKSGEPAWDSPWSKGRPGWHIECSTMAADVLGERLDIHAGGIDLSFPHHDNELAQSEAHYNCEQWVNYFLHAGHLHIEGQKMSKSLKNFVTIKDALKNHSARQLRIMFLQHTWSSVLDYKQTSIEHAIKIDTTFKNFFANVEALLREEGELVIGNQNFGAAERTLLNELFKQQNAVHEALCDSVDTPTALNALLSLIGQTNIYMQSSATGTNKSVLLKVGRYVTKILRVFGVVESNVQIGYGSSSSLAESSSSSSGNFEERVLPYLNVLSEFRDGVRSTIREGGKKEILALCDQLRDATLPELGVRLEDREGKPSLIKLDDKEVLLREMREKREKSESTAVVAWTQENYEALLDAVDRQTDISELYCLEPNDRSELQKWMKSALDGKALQKALDGAGIKLDVVKDNKLLCTKIQEALVLLGGFCKKCMNPYNGNVEPSSRTCDDCFCAEAARKFCPAKGSDAFNAVKDALLAAWRAGPFCFFSGLPLTQSDAVAEHVYPASARPELAESPRNIAFVHPSISRMRAGADPSAFARELERLRVRVSLETIRTLESKLNNLSMS